jgi:hypothetical protein
VAAVPPPPTATAAPVPAAPGPQQPAKTSDNSSATDTPAKKGDLDSFLKDVPSLRKKFGF